MKMNPKYAENIIVLTKYKKLFRWFVTEKDIWFLDMRKLVAAYIDNGFEIHNPDDFSDRYNISIVNEDTAEEFLYRISEFEANNEELRKSLLQRTNDHISEMTPSLYVDFDEKKLISYYPEPASYEVYVPDNWVGTYEEFTEQIPRDYRYWIVNGHNAFFSARE
ncbi:hypothetical protein [Terribacillus saccharophilus]|uniref:hypothetical protein n=1 Tax=Terribacillus saccharophilus TaxID=361277 RepID=UPI002989CED6|nr:hypothetical protein [Terribacillus saccharophilus]MCM3225732.1 hypothetical protein [Terribacillus saccharophilus]